MKILVVCGSGLGSSFIMLLANASESGIGRRYLIQHSAGSGKSNSIAWLAYQLVGLEHESKALFDSVIVVTDRRVLDKQIRDIIKQFAQVSATVGHAEHSGDLRKFLKVGKKIIMRLDARAHDRRPRDRTSRKRTSPRLPTTAAAQDSLDRKSVV